jgi:hypothetical protein
MPSNNQIRHNCIKALQNFYGFYIHQAEDAEEAEAMKTFFAEDFVFLKEESKRLYDWMQVHAKGVDMPDDAERDELFVQLMMRAADWTPGDVKEVAPQEMRVASS